MREEEGNGDGVGQDRERRGNAGVGTREGKYKERKGKLGYKGSVPVLRSN